MGSMTERRTATQLPRWRSHKVVEGFKIVGFMLEPGQRARLTGCGPDGVCSVVVSKAYIDKHAPKVGGYYVRYEDGYESWSPAAAFEAGYTEIVVGPFPAATDFDTAMTTDQPSNR